MINASLYAANAMQHTWDGMGSYSACGLVYSYFTITLLVGSAASLVEDIWKFLEEFIKSKWEYSFYEGIIIT